VKIARVKHLEIIVEWKNIDETFLSAPKQVALLSERRSEKALTLEYFSILEHSFD
jgi:hypothetical protein